MQDKNDKIAQLTQKLEHLLRRQDVFLKEIDEIKKELIEIRISESEEPTIQPTPIVHPQEIVPPKPIVVPASPEETVVRKPASPKEKSDLEKFIGENLISKIGIAITIIGVAIGAKYSIENNLISPLTRIILGYLMGFSLLGVGLKLKQKYESFSAVLVSGSMTIMYFITYMAYGLYQLFPQLMAFLLMVIITVCTVLLAIKYNRQIIAHVGLVGAYAVPFLLGDGTGDVSILFAYMVIINIGILFLSFKKYWTLLYYTTFGFTWLIFFSWYLAFFEVANHFVMAFSFLIIFYLIFYITVLAYKLLQKLKFEMSDVFLMLTNSFVFYGIGYLLLSNHPEGKELIGVFTACNALLHAAIGVVVFYQKLADKQLFYLIFGLAVIFITITIPVQFQGNWITLLWVGEGALLFWIGQSRKIVFYEKLSYPLMLLAFWSMITDWSDVYRWFDIFGFSSQQAIVPIFNVYFLTSLLFVIAFGFITWLFFKKGEDDSVVQNDFKSIMSVAIPGIFIFSLYYIFLIEINHFWVDSDVQAGIIDSNMYARNNETSALKYSWNINYTLLFLSLLSFVTINKFRSPLLGTVSLILNMFSLFIFLTVGLYGLSELRETYIFESKSNLSPSLYLNIGSRYIAYIFVAALLLYTYRLLKSEVLKFKTQILFDFTFHITILWISTSEVINLLALSGHDDSYKLGISILWGLYSLTLIGLGIWKPKKYLRIAGMCLFGVTLIKLFLYDISHMNTISKTIVFLALGILLLIISFLYNKYKKNIAGGGEG